LTFARLIHKIILWEKWFFLGKSGVEMEKAKIHSAIAPDQGGQRLSGKPATRWGTKKNFMIVSMPG